VCVCDAKITHAIIIVRSRVSLNHWSPTESQWPCEPNFDAACTRLIINANGLSVRATATRLSQLSRQGEFQNTPSWQMFPALVNSVVAVTQPASPPQLS
jgi:hypothetical protein